MTKPLFIWLAGAALLYGQPQAAQHVTLQPTPQYVQTEGRKIARPHDFRLTAPTEAPGTELLKKILPGQASPKSKYAVTVGTRGDKAVKKYAKLIPQQTEGYYLTVGDKEIVVAGNDARGTYYGLQTLAQLVTGDSLTLATVTDFPDIAYRGVVEGFYGTPWSHAARLRQLDFYGVNKLNTYIYGPKDDPYHTSPHWREPYPEQEARQIHELVEASTRNQVDFVWAIHPGRDIRWDESDRQALIDKFESMYQLGVRSFAVFFDDISGEGTQADKQAELLNYIDNSFVQAKGDVTPIIMCPTEYNKSWANVQGGYLTTLGERLNPGIEIMWTGDRVIACIDKLTMQWINPLLKRKAYIWWNFPVSDYVRDHLLLGAVYGNGLDIKDDMSGFVANPMERSEASKIALYSVADYAWNLKAYDSEASWNRALKALMPTDFEHLRTFAAHNSDLGPNGHGFRREESVSLQPALECLLEAYQSGRMDEAAYAEVSAELARIRAAADFLLTNEEAPYFVEEVHPWLNQFKLMGEYGNEVMQMVRATMFQARAKLKEPADGGFEPHYRRARTLLKQMYHLDASENQNPYQPGVKTGSRVLLPTLNSLFALSTERHNQTAGTALDTRAAYNPYTLESDVPQLARQPLQSRGTQVRVSPSNEVIKWPAGASVTIRTESPVALRALRVNVETPDFANRFQLCVSADGTSWQSVGLSQQTGEAAYTAPSLPQQDIRYIRLTNTSGQELEAYFKQFEFSVAR